LTAAQAEMRTDETTTGPSWRVGDPEAGSARPLPGADTRPHPGAHRMMSRGAATSRLVARSKMEWASSPLEDRVHKPSVLTAEVMAFADFDDARSRVPNLSSYRILFTRALYACDGHCEA